MSGVALENAMEAARKFMADTASYRAYLNREMYLHDQASNHAAAFADGREEGLAEGEKKTEARMQKLIHKLAIAKRFDDLANMADTTKLKALYAEFGI